MKTLITIILLASSIYAAPLDMTWNDNSDNEKGFIIERRVGPDTEPFEQIGNVIADSTAFTDPDAPLQSVITYRVYAFNDYGNSGYSNEAQILTYVPNKPDGLQFKKGNPLSRLIRNMKGKKRS
jgi:hypothetical protein